MVIRNLLVIVRKVQQCCVHLSVLLLETTSCHYFRGCWLTLKGRSTKEGQITCTELRPWGNKEHRNSEQSLWSSWLQVINSLLLTRTRQQGWQMSLHSPQFHAWEKNIPLSFKQLDLLLKKVYSSIMHVYPFTRLVFKKKNIEHLKYSAIIVDICHIQK